MERIVDIVCLIASYVILFLLPDEINVFFYLVFGVSAFLFCIGFFRLGFTFSTPAGRKGTVLSGALFTLTGLVINCAGLCGIYMNRGSGRSIMIATLLMIEALVLFDTASSKAEAPGTRWKLSMLFRAAAVVMAVFGIALMVKNDFIEASVMAGVMLVIEAICFWAMGSGHNLFHTPTSEIQKVPGMKTPIEELHRAFANVETQLGYPWIGRIKTIREDSMIYGPAEDGFYVYGYYHFGRFYVAGSENPLFPDPQDAQSHITSEIPDMWGTLLARQNLPAVYAEMFRRYAETGTAEWNTNYLPASGKDRSR